MAYAAVRTIDLNLRGHCANARLLIQEALHHRGTSWLNYDRFFCKQAAIDLSMSWNSLVPSLHTSAILGTHNSTGPLCSLCKGSDHTTPSCSLGYLQQGMTLNHQNLFLVADKNLQIRHPELTERICVSWNKLSCIYPGSWSYSNICATCQVGHKARECARTSPDFEYKTVIREPQSDKLRSHNYQLLQIIAIVFRDTHI